MIRERKNAWSLGKSRGNWAGPIPQARAAEDAFIKAEVRKFTKAIKLPNDIAGLSGREIYRTVDAAIRTGLTKLGANTTPPNIVDDSEADEPDGPLANIAADLAQMDDTALVTLRHTLQAAIIQLDRDPPPVPERPFRFWA